MSDREALERACEHLRERTAAWDDLRERRVLGRIEAELARTSERRRRGPWPWLAAAAMVLITAGWWRVRTDPVVPEIATVGVEESGAPATAPAPAIPSVRAPTLVLADGSVVTLESGAEVDLRHQSAERIAIDQRSGRVHYEVRPGLPRAFVIAAGDVEVRVVGTAFWIARDAARVRVTVEHGRVAVARAGASATLLGAGDELEIDVAAPVVAASVPAVASDAPRPPPRRRASEPVAKPTLEQLLAEADDARARGDATRAAARLRELVDRFADDPRAYAACFQLGKVERGRGRHTQAAAAFARAVVLAPSGSLSEDARAEAALSWSDAGRSDRARAAGDEYLARYPDGAHVARVRRMLDRLP